MARPTPVVPKYSHHKSTGRAFVKLDGKFRYLGPFGSAASRELYARLIREHQANGASTPAPTPTAEPVPQTVAAVFAAFWTHAKRAYSYDPSYEGRRPQGEIGCYHDAMQPALKLYGTTLATAFGPRALTLVQDEMIAMGWCRNVVNRQTVRLRTIFKWAVSQELIPGEILHRLKSVPGVRRGQRGVRDTPKVLPVPADVLNATLAFMSPRIAAMVKVQLLTGMRSSNLLQLRLADIDMSRETWTYKPREHKTAHHGHTLVIRIGPKTQAVLRPYLKPDRPEAFIWSPADEMAEVRAARTANRKTPASCGNKVGSNVKRVPKRKPGDHYSPDSYADAIERACDKANRWAKGGRICGDGDRLVARWHPHQLRHNLATAIRPTHGLDGVQAALGQRTLAVAERYAEVEADKAERIAAELG